MAPGDGSAFPAPWVLRTPIPAHAPRLRCHAPTHPSRPPPAARSCCRWPPRAVSRWPAETCAVDAASAPRLRRLGDHASLGSGMPSLRLARRVPAEGGADDGGGAGSRAPDGRPRGQGGHADRGRSLSPRGLDGDRPCRSRARHGVLHHHRRQGSHARAGRGGTRGGPAGGVGVDRRAPRHPRRDAGAARELRRGASRRCAQLPRGRRACPVEHPHQPHQPLRAGGDPGAARRGGRPDVALPDHGCHGPRGRPSRDPPSSPTRCSTCSCASPASSRGRRPPGCAWWPATTSATSARTTACCAPTCPTSTAGRAGRGDEVLGLEANGDVKGCPSLPSSEYVGGNVPGSTR